MTRNTPSPAASSTRRRAGQTDLPRSFPPSFRWGTSTSAYQVEGAWDTDGKAPSVWDSWQHSQAATPDGSSGDEASGQYQRLEEDLDLLGALGAQTHRFSVSWPRVVTDRHGTVNPAGLDYYERLVDGLLARGVAPQVALYHWDTPQWLEDMGGWMNRDSVARFAEYAARVAERLGDRVQEWFTMNEPTHPTLGGYVLGALPPGRALGTEGLLSLHHLLLAHGTAVQSLRSVTDARVGLIHNVAGIGPVSDHPLDIAAAERAEYFTERVVMDPLLGRGHLPELRQLLGSTVKDADERVIGEPIDLLGINWYSRMYAADPDRAPWFIADTPTRGGLYLGLADVLRPMGFALVPMPGLRWGGAHRQITPDGMRQALSWLVKTYPQAPPITISENGIGLVEAPDESGRIHDPVRVAYLAESIGSLHRAMADGVTVEGYSVWSSIDNLQWTAGFSQRFGLIYVDTQGVAGPVLSRIRKSSYDWYRCVAVGSTVPPVVEAPETTEPTPEVGGVWNLRGIGGLRVCTGGSIRPGLFLRSGSLHAVTPGGVQALERAGVAAVYDLRGKPERQHWPDGWAPSGSGTTVVSLLEELHLAEDEDVDLRQMYRAIIADRPERLVDLLRSLAKVDGAVLIHCTAGKDRTGVVTAMLLSVLNVCDEDILANFAESARYLDDSFVDSFGELPEFFDPAAFGAAVTASPAHLLRELLAQIRQQHGTVLRFLQVHGLDEDDVQALRQRWWDSAAWELSR